MGRSLQEVLADLPEDEQDAIAKATDFLVADELARRKVPQTQVVFHPCPGVTTEDSEPLGAYFYLRHPEDEIPLPPDDKVLGTAPYTDNTSVWLWAITNDWMIDYWPGGDERELDEQVLAWHMHESIHLPG
jgi:hypothetical protein